MSAGRAVFFDLDGTLAEPASAGGAEDRRFVWYPDTPRALRLVNAAGLVAIAITNQGAIGRGVAGLDAFWQRMAELEAELGAAGARLDAVYCCPHRRRDACACRKPGTALVNAAREKFAIDPAESFVVGDNGASDLLLAAAIGARGILVRTGRGERSLADERQAWAHVEPDYVATGVLDAAQWILNQLPPEVRDGRAAGGQPA